MNIGTILKWLAAVGTAGVLGALKAIAAKVGIPVASIDPLVQAAIVAAIVKLVTWLVGKLPVDA